MSGALERFVFFITLFGADFLRCFFVMCLGEFPLGNESVDGNFGTSQVMVFLRGLGTTSICTCRGNVSGIDGDLVMLDFDAVPSMEQVGFMLLTGNRFASDAGPGSSDVLGTLLGCERSQRRAS